MAFEVALKEYIAAQQFKRRSTRAQLNLAALHLARGQLHEARNAIETALAIDPGFVSAFVMDAEVSRVQEDEPAAERSPRRGLAASPASDELTHALGLSLIRQKRHREALDVLVEAARQAPDVSAMLMWQPSRSKTAGGAQRPWLCCRALWESPLRADLLFLLVTLKLEAGDVAGAMDHMKMLLELEPDNAILATLLRTWSVFAELALRLFVIVSPHERQGLVARGLTVVRCVHRSAAAEFFAGSDRDLVPISMARSVGMRK